MNETLRATLLFFGLLILVPLAGIAIWRAAYFSAANLLAATMRPGVRYTGWRWRVVRGYVLDRDGRRCVECGASYPVMHVHHKVLVRAGGSHQTKNLETMCPGCHRAEHPWMPAIPPDAAGPLAGSRRRRRAFRG